MTSTDRMAQGYQPAWDVDAALGHQGELWVGKVIDALRDGAVEVKTDARAVVTGNVYIEQQCWRRSAWTPSGITTTAAELYAIVLGLDPGVALVVPTWLLRDYCAHLAANPRTHGECTRGSHPTQGVLMPMHGLLEYVRNLARRPR